MVLFLWLLIFFKLITFLLKILKHYSPLLVFVLPILWSYIWYHSKIEETATDFPSLQFKKRHSMQRSPLFDGSNYNYWKCRMKIYLQSLNYELWNIIEAPYTKLTTNYTAWSDDQMKNANLDAKAMNALFLSLIHIWRCRRSTLCRSRWSPYH